jgi:hypothetical protein
MTTSLDSGYLGIETVYGWMTGIRFPAGTRHFSLHSVKTGSGVKPASYPVGTGGSFPGGKAAGV